MAYEEINWQNGSSGGTPLNADNLNHMDRAIKSIGDRSDEAYAMAIGSQMSAAESAEKAKAYELSAKASAEKAMSGTPEGYAQLVDDVIEQGQRIQENAQAIETKASNLSLVELKMLGWNVPSECPVQNDVNDNTFVQKVGRVDLGSLNWIYAYNIFYNAALNPSAKSNVGIINYYCTKYDASLPQSSVATLVDKTIQIPYGVGGIYLSIADSSYSDANVFKQTLKDVYLYYELETPITMQIDGNETDALIKKNVGKYKNLFNPALGSVTANGVTCEALGNGIYRLNGTSTLADGWQYKLGEMSVKQGTKYKIIGFRSDSESKFIKADIANVTSYQNNGCFIATSTKEEFYLKYQAGVTFSNEIVKVMITEDLSATYDDFVPYTGSGTNLIEDVSANRKMLTDEWQSSVTYGINALVIHNNALYKCKAQNSGIEPPSATYWEQTSVANELSNAIYKQLTASKVVSSGGTQYNDVWTYTATVDCVVEISAHTIWSSGQPTGLRIQQGNFIYANAENASDFGFVNASAIVQMSAGEVLYVKEKIANSNGTLNVKIGYKVNPIK